MSKESCVTLFPEIETVTRKLSNEQFGILIRAVIGYRFRGERYAGEDAALDIAFQFLASQVDRSEVAKEKKTRAAQSRWNAQTMHTDAQTMHTDVQPVQKDAPIQSVPVQSAPVQSVPVQSDPVQNLNTHSLPGAAPEKKAYGKFGWVRLTEAEFAQLEKELGITELNRCIAYVDESAQANGNRNDWSDFAVVLRKCSQQGWGLRRSRTKPEIPKGASGHLGRAELENIRRAMEEPL